MTLVKIDELTYSPTHVLDMEMSADCRTLREELVTHAAEGVEMPEEARDIWTGEVHFVEGSFVVTLYYEDNAKSST